MSKSSFLFGALFAGVAFGADPALVCENAKYRLEIDSSARTATVTHKSRPGTTFTTTRFQKTGERVPRYTVHGQAKALRYEGTRSEHWYEGEAVIRTSAALVGEDIVHSAQFLIDYDPYYTVTSWQRCTPH